ncbi:hypothetical protein [Fimbriimonas ginsengisoli]|uniref:Uncharacterized protein n=1 Tax=Fimbriimonas ginsengisoli Gsoil 348 TaxID=661478 RepID=A0A068NN02_FIMGI|nr:hypothetical protein [Fimbriimonas ginsengisoli]AIE84782.1 hypothetical protein OP10G_1414 [Fimbriimonas ginsengisoli Gsoil 348]
MIGTLVALAALSQGRQVVGITPVTFDVAYLPGQREIVVGAKPYRDTVMAIQYSGESAPLSGGGRIQAPVWEEHAEGYVRWSLQPSDLDGIKCLLLKTEGITKPKFHGVQVMVQAIRNYWLTSEGQILKQFDLQSDPLGARAATSIFHEDSVDIEVTEGKDTRKTTLYPGDAMSRIQSQFKPMMQGTKVEMDEKRFAVFNPFRGGYDEYTVKRSGRFAGPYMQIPFKGESFDIVGPKAKQRAFVSEEGDLVKVELPKNRFLVLTTAPASRETPYWTVPAKGGG